MEAEASLPHLHVPSTCPYPEPALSSRYPDVKWSFSLRLPHQNPVYATLLSHTRYMSRQFHYSPFDHPSKKFITIPTKGFFGSISSPHNLVHIFAPRLFDIYFNIVVLSSPKAVKCFTARWILQHFVTLSQSSHSPQTHISTFFVVYDCSTAVTKIHNLSLVK
jgi:hypothetical protein